MIIFYELVIIFCPFSSGWISIIFYFILSYILCSCVKIQKQLYIMLDVINVIINSIRGVCGVVLIKY
jgi:hypothetical protein